jgi:hypothetical protein
MLENNWREGQYVSPGHHDINGLHRIQLDEVDGTILSTHTTGMQPTYARLDSIDGFVGTVRSNCMQLREALWIGVGAIPPHSLAYKSNTADVYSIVHQRGRIASLTMDS